MKKKFLPISIDISGQKILVLGGEEDAYKKIKILQRFDAEIEVVAPHVCDRIKKAGIKYQERAYSKDLLSNYFMVYSCTNNMALDRQIIADCREKKVLVNIHDKPALCQFVSPAVYQNGNITIAVGSNGENVYESIRIRNLIQEKLELDLI